jgi:hypothetical protein
MDSRTVEWVRNVLNSRNDKTLAQRAEEVIRSTGPLGQTILEKVPNIGKLAADARAGVAHPDTKRKLGIELRYWYGELLHYVVRACLLDEVGVVDIPDRVLDNNSFSHALARVDALVDQQR